MSAPLKLTIFGISLLAMFGVAYILGGVLISPEFVDAWINQTANH